MPESAKIGQHDLTDFRFQSAQSTTTAVIRYTGERSQSPDGLSVPTEPSMALILPRFHLA
jgi:hypothetical protein